MGFEFGSNAKKPARKKHGLKMGGEGENPLDAVPDTDDMEADTQEELDTIKASFRARKDREAKRQGDATETEFWFAVYFESREVKEAFIQKIGAARLGDKFIDGKHFAALLGVELPKFD